MKSAMVGLAALAFGLTMWNPSLARASYHLWGINEVYSDASGTVQFVEMYTDSADELFTAGHAFTSSTKSLTLGHSFATPTNGHFFLMATPGYAALAGVPAPDFTFASNNFFNINGDTLTWQLATGNIFGAGQPATLTFTGAQLPKDGARSLAFNLTTNATNSPTNFAGQTGVAPEPGTLGAIVVFLGLLARPRI